MAVHDTTNFHLYVQLDDATYVEVGSLSRWARPRSRPRSRTVLLGGGTISKVGVRDETWSFSGILDDTDVGQQRLRTVEMLDQQVRIAFVRYGTTGYSYLANVTTTSHEATADESSDQTVSFDLDILPDTKRNYPPPPALAYTLDWNPLDPVQRNLPRAFVPELLTGYVAERHRPRYWSTYEANARGAYRRSATSFDAVAQVATTTLGGITSIVGPFATTHLVTMAYDAVAGPSKGLPPAHGKYHRMTAAGLFSVFGHQYAIVGKMAPFRIGTDLQDAHDARIGFVASTRIENAADIGKQLWIEVWTDNGSGGLGVLRSRVIVTYTGLGEEYRSLENTSGADEGETLLVYAFPDDDTLIPSSALVAYPGLTGDRRPTGSVDDDIAAGFYHDTFGATYEHEVLQAWVGGDDPVMFGGATKTPSTRPVPDSRRWWVAKVQQHFVLPAGGGMTATRAGKLASTTFPTSLLVDLTVPIRRPFVAIYISPNDFGWMPNSSGDLMAHITAQSSGEVIASVPLQRLSVDAFSAFRFSDGGAVYAADLSVNQAGQTELMFTPTITNNSGVTIDFYGCRCSMYCFVNDEERNRGIARLWMQEARTGEVMDNGGHMRLFDASALITANELFTGFRFVPFWNFADFYTYRKQFNNGSYVGVELLQTGPGGGNDYNFAISIKDAPGGLVELIFTMDRGEGRSGDPAPANPKSFGATLLLTPGDLRYFRAGQVCDVLFSAKDWAVDSLGLGFDAGSAITWYDNDSTFADHPVTFSASGTDVWAMQGLYCPGSDRDQTRQACIGVQRWIAGKVVAATFRASAEDAIADLWGARPVIS